ncbi:MAG TPA: hypothetical protein PLX86_12295, partial [Acidovorax defluvii]|nr:hypothetical protein [Acidovorax defluvii]
KKSTAHCCGCWPIWKWNAPPRDPLLPQRCSGLAVWRSGGLAKIQPFALRLSKGFDLKASGI